MEWVAFLAAIGIVALWWRSRSGSRPDAADLSELPEQTRGPPSVELYPRGDRPRPAGDWRQVQPQFKVAGIVHNKANAIEFVTRAAECDEAGRLYGLHLVREPTNTYDKKAIAVFGWWTEPSEAEPPEPRAVKIGYVPRDVTRSIPASRPIAAEIESLYLADRRGGGQFVNVQAYLLEPSKRRRKA